MSRFFEIIDKINDLWKSGQQCTVNIIILYRQHTGVFSSKEYYFHNYQMC